MTEDITKLPKWAQSRINVAEMRVQEAKAREAAMFASPADTDTLFDVYSDNPRPLPKGTRVSFQLGKQRLEVWVDKSGEFVEVYTSNGYPTILPWAANVFRIEVKP